MFHRRLALLAGLMLIPAALPAGRLLQLTIAKNEDLRAEAESRLLDQRWQPTTRGRILDRKDRVLAQDKPSFDVMVDYSVITGQWAFAQAAREARRQAGGQTWRSLSPVQREERIQQLLPTYRKRLDDGWAALARATETPIEEIEARRSDIMQQVSRAASRVWELRRQAREDDLARGLALSGDPTIDTIDGLDVPIAEFERPIREQVSAHAVLRGISDEAAFRLPPEVLEAPGLRSARTSDARRAAEARGDILPTLRVVDSALRLYPMEALSVEVPADRFPGPLRSEQPATINVFGSLTQIVGWMRDRVFAEDEQRRPRITADGRVDRGFYMPGDSVGHWGIEGGHEDELRGLRGLITEQLDTSEIDTEPRTPGKDIKLTIDANLQARIAALCSPDLGLTTIQPWQRNRATPVGTNLNAAAVIIEVDTGDILAMVSTPTFTLDDVRERPESVFINDPILSPAVNRAAGKPYAPGSIVKPLLFCAAVSAGVWDPDRRVACNGHLLPDRPNLFRCWVFKPPFNTTHDALLGGALSAQEALAVSCNIYFYQVGRALGPDGVSEWYGRFGVGNDPRVARPTLRLTGSPVFAGSAGAISPDSPLSADDQIEMGEPNAVTQTAPPRARRGVTPSEATLMGIGQGPVAWTPLHAADAYATLARSGLRIVPRLRMDEPLRSINLGLNPRSVAIALEGLSKAVNDERGTGHHITVDWPDGARRENIFTAPGVQVWGKSGTADSGQKARDAQGRLLADDRGQAISLDHAWFVVLAGRAGENRPRYAVAVLVEFGGSGGRIAGPLTNQILLALKAEGYL